MLSAEHRSLGHCGVTLPQLGFGCAPIGELFTRVSDEDAEATLQAAWNAGIRYFDTAPWYGRGMSERRLGAFLSTQQRDSFTVSTKVGRILDQPQRPEDLAGTPWVGGDPMVHRFDYTYDGIMRSYEDSLKRLKLDRVDLLLIHDLDYMHHATAEAVAARMEQLTAGGGWRALSALKDSRAIRGIGSGVNELGTIPRMLDAVDVDFFLVALRYTLMEQETLTSELPRCAQNNIGVIIGGVFNSGITATGATEGAKYNYREPTAEERDRVSRIAAVCSRYDVPLAAAALQFPLAHPRVASVIPGAFTPDHVSKNLGYLEHPITDALWSALKDERLIRQDAPVPTTIPAANKPMRDHALQP